MAKRRIINTKFWSDTWVAQLDPTEKLLFLYLLSNERTNISGIYELPLKYMALETGIEKEMIEKIFSRFEKNKKVHYIDGWVFLPNFLKHQELNPSVETGIKRELGLIPNEIKKSITRLGTGCRILNLNLTKPIGGGRKLKNDGTIELNGERLSEKQFRAKVQG